MKRSGFTMIELVFVIVILGILASVAIPKLAATRDDANIAKASTEISSMVSDMGSYYTAKGHFGKVSDMTNVKLTDSGYAGAGTKPTETDFNNGRDEDLEDGTYTTPEVHYVDAGRGYKCFDIHVNDANGTLQLVKDAEADSSLFCKGLSTAVASLLDVNHTFGGSSIY